MVSIERAECVTHLIKHPSQRGPLGAQESKYKICDSSGADHLRKQIRAMGSRSGLGLLMYVFGDFTMNPPESPQNGGTPPVTNQLLYHQWPP